MKNLNMCKELCGYFFVRAAGNENFIRYYSPIADILSLFQNIPGLSFIYGEANSIVLYQTWISFLEVHFNNHSGWQMVTGVNFVILRGSGKGGGS